MQQYQLIDIGERAGIGIPELFAVWEKESWEEPVIEERYEGAARTTVILSFNKKATIKNGNKKRRQKYSSNCRKFKIK